MSEHEIKLPPGWLESQVVAVQRCTPVHGTCYLASGHAGPHHGYPIRVEDLIASQQPRDEEDSYA